MKNFKFAVPQTTPSWVRILGGFVVLAVAESISGRFVPDRVVAGPHALPWQLCSWLLVAAVLGWAALSSGWSRFQLGVSIFVLLYGTALVNIVEGAYYIKTGPWGAVLVVMFIALGIVAAAMGMLYRRGDAASVAEERGRKRLASMVAGAGWRLLVCDVLYLVIYLTAGMIIIPFVRSFYATQHIPPMSTIVGLQLLLRGPMFTVAALLLSRMLSGRRVTSGWRVALGVGTIFAALTGIAPLMVPTTFFPDHVRLVHLCEVTGSNFVFGVVATWIWRGWLKLAKVTEPAMPGFAATSR
ncbi:MAG TPA: hypothetical protein VGD64_01540 [Acidisarcina sp.]